MDAPNRDTYMRAIPVDVSRALAQYNLQDAYRERPAYQKREYIGWITDARRGSTRERRKKQMLKELRKGDRYMGSLYLS